MTFFQGSSSSGPNSGRVQYVFLSATEIEDATTGSVGNIYVDEDDNSKRYFWNPDTEAMEAIVTDETFSSVSQDSVNNNITVAQDRSTHTGHDNVRVVTITANYTILNADLRDPTIILANSPTPITVFYPANSTISVKAGVPIKIVQWGVGAVTLAGASGINVVGTGSPTTRGQYAVLEATKILTNTVLVSQEILASGGPVLVSPPVVSGSGVQGSTLTVTAGTYSPDGTHTRQWRRINLSTGAITNVGAGGTTYASVVGDVGSGIDCVETVTDSNGLSTQGVSNRITIVAAASKPVNTVTPFIVQGSSSTVGGTVTVNAGTWSNSPTGYKFQRKLDGTNDGTVTDQAGSTLAYTIQSADSGKNISWTVTAYNGSGDADASASSPSWPVVSAAPVFTAFPVITYSSVAAGATMTCSNGTVTPSGVVITKRWGFYDPTGPFEGYIQPPQTAGTYDTNATDIGSQIWCEVTATNASGFVTFKTLGPTITGTVVVQPPTGDSTQGVRPTVTLVDEPSVITAVSNQTISGKRFTASRTYHIIIPLGVSGVTIEDCEFSGSTNAAILNQGSNTTIRHIYAHDCTRGVYTNYGGQLSITYSKFHNIEGGDPFEASGINTANNNGPILIDHNTFSGRFNSDVVSNYAISRLTMTNNTWDVDITYETGAAFTVGDTAAGEDPGRDNYIAFNTITQTGSASAAGVFGSTGNTIIEYNCFKSGIQMMFYPPENPAPFVGVTVRNNVINFSMSNLNAVSAVTGWATNINGTDCGLMPA